MYEKLNDTISYIYLPYTIENEEELDEDATKW